MEGDGHKDPATQRAQDPQIWKGDERKDPTTKRRTQDPQSESLRIASPEPSYSTKPKVAPPGRGEESEYVKRAKGNNVTEADSKSNEMPSTPEQSSKSDEMPKK